MEHEAQVQKTAGQRTPDLDSHHQHVNQIRGTEDFGVGQQGGSVDDDDVELIVEVAHESFDHAARKRRGRFVSA